MSGNEAPSIYHQWCGLSVLAGAVRRNIWIDSTYFDYFPNMYIVLVGPPAIKKGTAMNAAKRMLSQVGPRIKFAHDSTTREALIDALRDSYIGDLGYSAISAFSSEFGTMLQSSQAAMIDFLTSIYSDYDRQNFVHGTVGRGERIVVKPYFNLIACTTPDFINRSLPSYSIGTGFTSRVLFVYCDKPGKLVARPKLTPEQEKLYPQLVMDLKHIATLQGEVRWSDESEKWFDKWYGGRRAEIEGADIRLAGFIGRKPLHVQKVAMLLGVSQRNDLTLRVEDLERALAMMEQLEPGVRKLFCSVGRNIFAPITHRIAEQLVERGEPGLRISALLMRNLGDVDSEELQRNIDTLRTLDLVQIIPAGKPQDCIIRPLDKCYDYVLGNWQPEAENV